MTPDDTLERHLADGLASIAGTGAPDYLDDVLRRSSRTRQRRAWLPLQRSVLLARAPHERAGWTTGRSLSMIPILRIVAVAVLALAVGVVIDPLRPPTPFGAADPSPSASPAPTPARLPDGPLPAGTYVAIPFAARGSDACYTPPQSGCSEAIPDDDIRVMLTVPDGWSGMGDLGIELADTDPNPSTRAALILERGAWLHTDPCTGGPDIPVGPTVADFADALAGHPLLDVTTPVDITLAGYNGKYLELQVPVDLAGCDVYRPWEPGIFTRRPGEQWFLTILDVDGLRVVIREMVHEGTSPEVKAQLQGIVESIAIEPATAPAVSPSPSSLAWTPASLEQDWPAPVRAEPVGDPVVVRWDQGYTDARGDIESSDVPWIDILSVKRTDHVRVGVGAPAPSPLAGSNEPWIAYGLVLDTDRDGVADVRFGMDRVPAELTPWRSGPGATDVRAWRTDLKTGTTEFGNSDSSVCDCLYPGAGATAYILLGKEGRFLGRFYVWAAVIQDGRVVATDYAPDTGWLE